MFWNKKEKAEIERLTKENQRLYSLLSPQAKEIDAAEKQLAYLNVRLNEVSADIKAISYDVEQKNKESLALEKRLDDLKSQVIVQEELIELESFSLYSPRFSFATVLDYKEKLAEVRETQKNMIKAGTAASGANDWSVDGSRAAGQRLVEDTKKLCLRSFNMECDAAVDAVRFNNYDRCEKRIYTSASAVSKLGAMMKIAISKRYIELKIAELQLALEYQQKKQEEKEQLRELRAQERESAKLAKEIEEARKACLKEQLHYNNALTQILKQLAECKADAEREDLLSRESEIRSHLNALDENMKQIDYREANQRAGYVYIISNIGSFGEGVYKIGMTRRLEPQDRVDELGDASVPFTFDVHAMIFSEDAPALEAALHRAFQDRRVNMVNSRREFFRVTLDEIMNVVHDNFDKIVEFVQYPAAEQYRETLKIVECRNGDSA